MIKRFLLILLLILPMVYAGGLDMEVKSVQPVFTQRECGEYFLYLTDNEYYTDVIDFKYMGDEWRIKSEPSSLETFTGRQGVVKLSVCPLNTAKFGEQSAEIVLWSNSYNLARGTKLLDLVYVPENDIIETRLLPSFVDPRREQNLIQVNVKNNYNVNFKDLKVELQNEELKINEKQSINLGPFQEKSLTFKINLDESVQSGKKELTINFYNRNDYLFAKQKKDLDIGYSSDVKEDISVNSGWFINEIKITKKNEGNSKIKDYYSTDLNFVKKFFTNTYPIPVKTERVGSKYTLTWETEIEPGKEYDILIVTGYRGFLITVLLCTIIYLLGYFFLGREILITKKVLTIHAGKEGVAGVKILLIVKNKSKRTITNLKVLDKIPNLAVPIDDFGTLRPIRVKNSITGRTLIWEVNELQSGEEVVISYALHANMDLFGKTMLPSATAKYVNKIGRRVAASSNKLMLFSMLDFKRQ